MTATDAIHWAIHTMICEYPKWCMRDPDFIPFALERLEALRPYVKTNNLRYLDLDTAVAQIEKELRESKRRSSLRQRVQRIFGEETARKMTKHQWDLLYDAVALRNKENGIPSCNFDLDYVTDRDIVVGIICLDLNGDP